MRGSVLLCAIGAVCAPAVCATGLAVREDAIAVRFADHAARIVFEVSATQAQSARLEAEWLDPRERVVAHASTTVKLRLGEQSLVLSTASPIGPYTGANEGVALALRLHYSLVTAGDRVDSIASLSSLRSNYRVLAPNVPQSTSLARPLRFFIRALDARGYPAPDARVQATVILEGNKQKATQTVAADASGKAVFEFPWPRGLDYEDVSDLRIAIDATSGDVHRTGEVEVEIDKKATLYVSTDKALYQPGQTLHMRAIGFDEFNKALDGADLEFHVYKGANDLLFKTSVKASRFGVAAADWAIPDNAETADCRVTVSTKGSVERGDRQFRLARYELPTFEFTAKPLRDSAKPGDKVTVAIDAKYLFGAPLKKGSVKIKGKPALTKAATVPEGAEGELDERGHAAIELELPHFEDEQVPWRLTYSVAVTEPDTKREEERVFSIALREGSIWLSVQGATYSRKQPRTLYVRARHHSGQPCVDCSITVSEYSSKGKRESSRRLIATARTNAFGIVEVPNYSTGKMEEWADRVSLRLEVSDPRGNTGSEDYRLDGDDDEESAIEARIDAKRLLYRPGEPAQLSIVSPDLNGSFVVGVAHTYKLLDSFQVQLKNGRLDFEYRYQDPVDDQVTFVVARAGEENTVLDQVTVFYKRTQALRVDVKTDKTEYRPGDTVHAQIQVRGMDGKPAQAALGASAIDRAVILRAQGSPQDREPVVDDGAWLQQLDFTKRLSTQDNSLVRFLSRERHYPDSTLNFDFEASVQFQNVFTPWLSIRLAPYRRAVLTAVEAGTQIPVSQVALEEIWRKAGLDWTSVTDPWGKPFKLQFYRYGLQMRCVAASNGPGNIQSDIYALDWFSRAQAKLRTQLHESPIFPISQAELDAQWTAAGLTDADRVDPWGQPLQFEFGVFALRGLATYVYAEYHAGNHSNSTEEHFLRKLTIKSPGEPDGRGHRYPFMAAEFIESPQQTTSSPKSGLRLTGGAGIAGTIVDPSGAVIVGAKTTVKDTKDAEVLSVQTGDNGEFIFAGLPAGEYTVDAESPGFNHFRVVRVPVSDRIFTPLTITLRVGSVSESVEVSAGISLPLQTSMAMVALTRGGVSGEDSPEPRLRKEFLETLLWRPLLETDSRGRATIEFPLADNITTWSFTAVGSTLDGRVSTAEAEIRVFQPFFIEHAPPPILTSGDELWLPVLLRNFLKSPQDVTFRVDPGTWFTLDSARESTVQVPASGTAEQTVHFTATRPVKEGTQRITALAGEESDAIEKKVEVRPFGRRAESTATELFNNQSTLVIDIPPNATALSSTLTLHPDPASHIFTAQAALLERPYGCGEQTISSTYPSLLILSHGNASQADQLKARRYLRLGYDRLLGYRISDGGLAYFHGEKADLSITAYAIEFLTAASKVIEVDPAVLQAAVTWLEKQQHADGTWGSRFAQSDDRATAYIARVLSLQPSANPKVIANAAQVLAKWTDKRDPYLLAQMLPVLRKAGDPAAVTVAQHLRELAQPDRGGMSWNQAGATPFYGWGRAGTMETTAAVVSALIDAGDSAALARQGLVYLLRSQDSLGAWYSSHATIRVLEALLALPPSTGKALHATLNGTPVAPGTIALKPGRNEIQLDSAGAGSLASATVSSAYYVPWANGSPEDPGMKLEVKFDRTTAKAGDVIECRVLASRPSGNRYGMSIAEIGLPPGAEVDRASLETNPRICRHEIQPDRVILYLWGNEDFTFRFRPRFAMKAWQAESVFYDYYNPDARTVVAPVRFDIAPKL